MIGTGIEVFAMDKSIVSHQPDFKFHGWQSPCNDGSVCEYDKTTGLEILQINTIQSLVQALGYLKFSSIDNQILYRGQTQLYNTGNDDKGHYLFQPSALRGVKRTPALTTAKNKIKKQVDVLRRMVPRFKNAEQFSDAVLEGLLQQYGIPTTWFDAVDNVWIALWFACYRSDNSIFIGKTPERRSFWHMVRRNPRLEAPKDRFAYVFVLGADANDAELIDLRNALPSDYIRPHAQHGVMIRTHGVKSVNMNSLIKGIVRVRLEDALDWLGDGGMLRPEAIVPPPNYDSGFKMLLNSERQYAGKDVIRFPIYC